MNVTEIANNYVNQYQEPIKNEKQKKEQEKPLQETTDKLELGGEQVEKATYNRPKGLNADQVKLLSEQAAANEKQMLEKMIQGYIGKQAAEFSGYTHLNFDGVVVPVGDLALPALADTPEGAKAAIAEGGAYSVDEVAKRITSLAETMANGDATKLKNLKDAVTKGFQAAGMDFKSVTKDDLPQICHDTYAKIMDKFDELEKEWTKPAEKPAEQPAS